METTKNQTQIEEYSDTFVASGGEYGNYEAEENNHVEMQWGSDSVHRSPFEPIQAKTSTTSFLNKLKRPLGLTEERIVKRKSRMADFNKKGPVADSPRVEVVTADIVLEEGMPN